MSNPNCNFKKAVMEQQGGLKKSVKPNGPLLCPKNFGEKKPPKKFGIRVYSGGGFQIIKTSIVWVGGEMKLISNLSYAHCDFQYLDNAVRESLKMERGQYKIWYRKSGKTLSCGRKLLLSDADVKDLLRSLDKMCMVDVYVVIDGGYRVVNNGGPRESNASHKVDGDPTTFTNEPSPKSSSLHTVNVEKRYPNSPKTVPNAPTEQRPPKLQPRRNISLQNSPHHAPQTTPPSKVKPYQQPRRSPRGHSKVTLNSAQITHNDPHLSSLNHLATTSKSYNYEESLVGKTTKPFQPKELETKQGKAKKVRPSSAKKKLTYKSQKKRKVVEEVQSDEVDTDPDYVEDEDSQSDAPLDETNFDDVVGEDLFTVGIQDNDAPNFRVQEEAIPVKESRSQIRLSKDLEGGFNLEDEIDYESDNPGSLCGSDEEVDPSPVFNPEVDFQRAIKLRVGLRFPNVDTLREALRQHAIECHYDYFTLHNGSKKLTAYCKHRCLCEWDKKRSKKKGCTCGVLLCPWKVYAVQMKDEDTIQIRTFKPKHDCGFQARNRKVSSKFLAQKYLEDWRTDPQWHLVKGFGARIVRDIGVECNYSKLWLARARAKLMLYGDGADQYKRVWDYVNEVKKVYAESIAIVCCDGILTPPPIFQRMFISLKPVVDGFKRGCRPIIGLDGTHLTGAYPGVILVAVGADGNNNIYPIAWAVVEIEKTDSWTWFIDLLASALGTRDGKGWTFMSDRQKGLLEAFSNVVPEADIRFCWRHIWQNFKLKWNGQNYKDTLWAAAKATTKPEFDKQMGGLKWLNPAAHAYMDNIPTKHWSRHAFPSTSKSKMLLNNMCESFNNVLRQARDKPIITLMEWMRRYVMSRSCQKREGVQQMKSKYMPYVYKQLEWAQKQLGYCILSQSSADLFEVEYFGDRVIVDLSQRYCSCYGWELTGIPCHHAVAVILYRRGNVEDFVDDCYLRERYMAAYEPVVVPMPGPKYWEKMPYPEPIPPPMKTMPGRPSKKHRTKEPGEDEEHAVKVIGKKHQCSKCKGYGHNKLTCKNPPVDTTFEQKNKGGKPFSTEPWTVHAREKKAKGKGKKKKQQNDGGGLRVDGSSQASTLTSAAGPSQHIPGSPSHYMGE